MKSAAMRKKFPATPAEWEAMIAAAPGEDRPFTAAEEKKMANAVVFKATGTGWQTRMHDALLEWVHK